MPYVPMDSGSAQIRHHTFSASGWFELADQEYGVSLHGVENLIAECEEPIDGDWRAAVSDRIDIQKRISRHLICSIGSPKLLTVKDASACCPVSDKKMAPGGAV